MELTFENGKIFPIVTVPLLDQQLRLLNVNDNKYAILSKDDESFIQTAILDPGFVLEYHDNQDRHFVSFKDNYTIDEIILAFSDFLTNRKDWSQNHPWQLDERHESSSHRDLKKLNLHPKIFVIFIILCAIALLMLSLF